jgi:predicted Zn-ribbon and HTH transcriptional regulator
MMPEADYHEVMKFAPKECPDCGDYLVGLSVEPKRCLSCGYEGIRRVEEP